MDDYDKELERLQKEMDKLDSIKRQREILNNLRIEQEKLKQVEVKPIEQEPTLKETVRELNSLLRGEKGYKKEKNFTKKFKLLRRAKLSKSKIKKGWSGILFLNENKTIKGEKVKLDGGTYKTKDGSIHVTNGQELIFWEGKYPLLFQRYDKLNPVNLFAQPGDVNEIYGQTMVELRMKKDLIKDKPAFKMGWIMIVIILVGGYFLIKTFFPKLFGG